MSHDWDSGLAELVDELGRSLDRQGNVIARRGGTLG